MRAAPPASDAGMEGAALVGVSSLAAVSAREEMILSLIAWVRSDRLIGSAGV